MLDKTIARGVIVLALLSTGCQSIEGKKALNRLADEKSPYLLQHADNPVDWYPWGEDAFAAAAEQDKPIFLSIGYSTCHWCHVMEHESFEDTSVADLMNEYFISVKVDREERPDIDNIYMTVCQMLTGGGGWPLTIVMTPDKKPFFAGTYFPKEGRFDRMGMLDLVPRIGNMWRNDRGKLLTSADKIVNHLQSASSPVGTKALNEQTLKKAYQEYVDRFDNERGGLEGRMKFPTAHNLSFLLRYWKRTGEGNALQIVEKTLQEMRKGGIWDHVGLGYHRYSTDPDWLVPHFEKMLYDQAVSSIAYLEAYQATDKEEYARTAREIFAYVLRDMVSPEGGFYSAEDADSEGEEGKFYLWTAQEITDILGENDGRLFNRMFNIRKSGNFREEGTGESNGRNIPHLKFDVPTLADKEDIAESEMLRKMEEMRSRLFEVREKRVHPLKDDKILTDWNGLMIAALAKGAQVLGDETYAAAATKAADFVLDRLMTEDGRLIKRYRQGVASFPAHLEDYAFTLWGLLELYEATFELTYLSHATKLTDTMIDLFWDDENGGFFFTADDGEALIVRTKEIYDGAIPSGNSVAASVLLRTGRITGNTVYEEKAAMIGSVFSPQVERSPSGYSQLLSAIDFGLGPAHEIVIVGDPESRQTGQMLRKVQQMFLPNKVILFKSTTSSPSLLTEIAPFTETQHAIDGKATAYICQNYVCNAPTSDVAKMTAALK